MSDLPASNQVHTNKRVAKMSSNQPTNLNHLLNFTLPPRQSRPFSSLPRRSRKTGATHGIWNKERFVNAQYRFVMNPNGDYTVHFADPDIFFQWPDILQVIIPRSSVLTSAAATGDQISDQDSQINCPICLSPPTAPRMTKCGHIFCFPCILHYLGTSDKNWARCPICFDSVIERQLKSVKWFDSYTREDVNVSASGASSSSSTIDNTFESAPRSGASLCMRLIERPQITTLALPRSYTWPSELLPPHQAPLHFLPDVYNFSKFMLATPSYLVSHLTRDLDELASERRLLAGMADDLGVSFVDGAKVKVQQQIDSANALDTPILRRQIEKALKDHQDIEDRVAFHARKWKKEQVLQEEIPTEFLAVRSSTAGTPNSAVPSDSLQPPSPKESLPKPLKSQPRSHPRQRRNINPPPPTTQTYYYYQAASGLPIFLHPLDIRILLSHFSSYSSFPDTITVRVDAFSESTIDDDLRKRCKYLAHMPEGADVLFIEADLEGVVGADSLKNFEGPLKSRASRRREKGKKEDRAKVKAEEREREKEKLWAVSATSSASHSYQVSTPRNSTQPAADELAGLAASEAPQDSGSPDSTSAPPPQPQQISGAWGARSFASALHSPPTQPPSSRSQQRNRTSAEDEWDLDIAWHELEQRAGGRRKKGAKLVVLGGGGGRRR